MLHLRTLAPLLWLLFAPPVGVHAADLLFAPVETAGSPVDSAAELRSALEARDRVVVESASLGGLDLTSFEAVWVCLGVYPHTHPLTFTEGVKLKGYLESGGTLYLEGGDIWGYDILTPLNTIDGITASADGGSDLFAIEGVAGDNGSDWSALSATYAGENSNLDHIYADLPGASVVLSRAGGAYEVGVLHLGSQSSLADFRLLGVTFEFGGVTVGSEALLEEILIALELEPDCRFDPPTTPECEVENQRVELSWQNLAPYASLEIIRDEVTIAVLPPTVTSYVDLSPAAGMHQYIVRATGGDSCVWESGACSIEVPIADLFRRGDSNADATIDLTDCVQLLDALFVPNSILTCPDAGDINDSGSIDISDAILLLRHIFEAGLPPSAPGLGCGIDPTTDALGPCAAECTQ